MKQQMLRIREKLVAHGGIFIPMLKNMSPQSEVQTDVRLGNTF